MQIELNQEADVLRITGALTIQTIEEAHTRLCSCVEQACIETIDLAQVDACDAAGVQLLVGLGKSLACLNKPLRIRETSPVFREVAAMIGVSFDIFRESLN